MCGIVGFYSGQIRYDVTVLHNMLIMLTHRGPDKQNIFIDEPFYLGHARLSIIDLSDLATQPMISANGRYIIVYNGEVYNFKELSAKYSLQTRSHSDTEVILELFSEKGIGIVNELNGMFAFAIYDIIEKKIFFARDRVGKKPLFYFTDNNFFAFASEIKALLKHPYIQKKLTINCKAINYFLHLGFIPEPETIYNEIKKFPAGYVGIYKNNVLELNCYWNLDTKLKTKPLNNELQAKEELHQLLKSAVAYRLISDVPYGVFLSGGIDSSLVAAIAQQLTGNLKTFSIGFVEQKYNEAPFAKKVADFLKTDHTEYVLNINDALSLLEDYFVQYDEPFADSSALPTMMVSKLARQKVTVVLSGDGGDELFWGYGAYRWAKRLKQPWVRFCRKPMARCLSLGNNRHKRISNLFKYEAKEFLPSHIFSQEQYYFSQREIKSILKQRFIHQLNFQSLENIERISEVELQSLFDFRYYLKDDLMVKVDRASMRFSLEVRSPIIDYRIIEFAYNLAPQLKHNRKIDKYLLKQILYEYIPAKYFNRPKWGFSVPINRWLKNELNNWMRQLLSSDTLQRYPFVDDYEIEKYIKRFEAGEDYLYGRIWNLMVLIGWLERNYANQNIV